MVPNLKALNADESGGAGRWALCLKGRLLTVDFRPMFALDRHPENIVWAVSIQMALIQATCTLRLT